MGIQTHGHPKMNNPWQGNIWHDPPGVGLSFFLPSSFQIYESDKQVKHDTLLGWGT